MKHEILGIKALIEHLRASDTGLRVFGANGHRYRIGPHAFGGRDCRF